MKQQPASHPWSWEILGPGWAFVSSVKSLLSRIWRFPLFNNIYLDTLLYNSVCAAVFCSVTPATLPPASQRLVEPNTIFSGSLIWWGKAGGMSHGSKHKSETITFNPRAPFQKAHIKPFKHMFDFIRCGTLFGPFSRCDHSRPHVSQEIALIFMQTEEKFRQKRLKLERNRERRRSFFFYLAEYYAYWWRKNWV